jgi:hypothetical protein
MPGFLLHVGAIINCPHAGTVTAPPPSPPRVFVNGVQAVLTIKELYAVAACPFQIPFGAGTKPQPCVTVRVEPASRVLVNGLPAAILTPAAICQSAEQIPQGPPNSSPIQKRVQAT